jgi:hypothetical protein
VVAEEEAARLKAEEEAEVTRIAAEKLAAEEAEAARLKAEEEAEATRILAEEEAALKIAAEVAVAARLKAEEAESARLKAEEEAEELAARVVAEKRVAEELEVGLKVAEVQAAAKIAEEVADRKIAALLKLEEGHQSYAIAKFSTAIAAYQAGAKLQVNLNLTTYFRESLRLAEEAQNRQLQSRQVADTLLGSESVDQFKMRATAFCVSAPCANDADCIGDKDWFGCVCTAGYSGALCANDMDECNSKPCANQASCTDSNTKATVPIDSYHCSCVRGYVGKTCNEDIDDCESSPCKASNTVCKDRIAAYVCACTNGWTGPDCSTDFNECSASPCRGNAICYDSTSSLSDRFSFVAPPVLVGDFICVCPDFWLGSNFRGKRCDVLEATVLLPAGFLAFVLAYYVGGLLSYLLPNRAWQSKTQVAIELCQLEISEMEKYFENVNSRRSQMVLSIGANYEGCRYPTLKTLGRDVAAKRRHLDTLTTELRGRVHFTTRLWRLACNARVGPGCTVVSPLVVQLCVILVVVYLQALWRITVVLPISTTCEIGLISWLCLCARPSWLLFRFFHG